VRTTTGRDRVETVRNAIWIGIVAVLTLWLAAMPHVGGSISFSFYLMLWITMASAFNIISGFTGYMPFGYVAFYGIGAFAAAILHKNLQVPIFAAIPLAGLAGVLLSLLLARTLRLNGIYFAIVSLALGIILRLIISNLPEEIAGGSYGINIGARSSPIQSFYAMLIVMLACLLTVTWLARSRLGTALRAIRDDADAADAMGINVPRARLYGWILAALFPSLCGAIDAWYTNVVDPETSFNILITAKTVIYASAGGLGTLLGPLVGAIMMVWIDELFWQRFPLINLLLLGLAIIVFIQFMPRGVIGTLLQRYPRLRAYVM
jgi:branched-chain amino acid transport system permease protein